MKVIKILQFLYQSMEEGQRIPAERCEMVGHLYARLESRYR
jgi:hypothetical protein